MRRNVGVTTVTKTFIMDLGRFVKSSAGCFFVFYEKGNYDIVCNKLKQLRFFPGRKRNACLFTNDVASALEYMKGHGAYNPFKGVFVGSFYNLAYDFLKSNNIVGIADYKTEEHVVHIIEDLFSRESVSDMLDVEEVKVEFYKRESEQFLKSQLDKNKNKEGEESNFSSGIVFGKGTRAEENARMTSLYSAYLECKRQCCFWDGEDVLFLLYKRLKEDSHLRAAFSLLLQDVFVLDFSTVTSLQRIILQECFSQESLYIFLIDANEKSYLDQDFEGRMSVHFPGSFFLDFPSGDYSLDVFDCANDFLETVSGLPRVQESTRSKRSFENKDFDDDIPFSISRRCSNKDFFDVNVVDKEKVINFLSSTIDKKEVDLISLVIRKVIKENKVSPSEIIVFTTKEKCNTVIRGLKKDGIKVSENGSIGVRVEDIKNACRVDDAMYVFIYGLSSSKTYITKKDFYFALLSASKKIFLSYSLMSNIGGDFVKLVRSEFLDMLSPRYVNEDVLTASKISICNKEFSFKNKTTVFSYSFIKKRSIVGK